MPPTKKTTQARPPTPAPTEQPTADTGHRDTETSAPRKGTHVRFELDGFTGHGLVLDRVAGDTGREEAVSVAPLPDAITVPLSALVKD